MAAYIKALAAIMSVLAVATSGCVINIEPPIVGSGVLAMQDRQVKEFDAISLRCVADVTVTAGSAPSLLIQTDNNIIDLISTRVDGKTLRIEGTRNYKASNPVKITITVPSLEEMEVTGGGNVDISALDEKKFELRITGSGDVHVVGTAQNVKTEITGSGNAKLGDLVAQSMEIHILGSGDAEVHVEEKLDVHITGSGDVAYTGEPKSTTRHITGSGDVRKVEKHED